MKPSKEKPPVLVYAVFGETGKRVWHVLSVTDQSKAFSALNSMNKILRDHQCHSENEPVDKSNIDKALALLKALDTSAAIDNCGARYSMIEYKYNDARDAKRLPPGMK